MQALAAKQRGVYSDVLQLQHVADAKQDLQSHDVLIKLAYADLNPVDLQKLANGPTIEDVFIPGYGGSGIVEHVGSAAPPHLMGKQVCFLADPNRKGSYASYIVVDHRCVCEIPSSKTSIELRDAASIPVAGLTAYECLVKLGLAADIHVKVQQDGHVELEGVGLQNKQQEANSNQADKSLLIVGASGGVGSWLLTLVKAWHPSMEIIATASPQSEEWCKSLGATKVIRHHQIDQVLKGGKEGSVDYIVSLTEPTQTLFKSLTEVVKPYGKIVLVVAGKGIESLNLGFCFFKCVNVYTETVFSSIRTQYKQIVPKDELAVILNLMANQTIKAPLSPALTDDGVGISEKFSDALKDNGVLQLLAATTHKRGKLVMMIHAGNQIVFMDLKTASIFSVPHKECIAKKYLTKSKKHDNEWQEQSQIIEKQELIKKITSHPKLGVTKVAEKQAQDYQDGLEVQEAENVKNLWGVSLKKREKNVKGEELLFVDLRTGALGELARKKFIELGALTLGTNDEGQETVEQAVTDFEDRDDIVSAVRQALKINLDA
ncbi:furan-3-one reductase [Seminavis robusta]|uniref:Furan-3-one reductase n=1 Tax=Seminavis robusta TaxID=568900 RepID=A0A9N8DLA7_9STRA|nr:furan-3-one reductase [Seminavis robusta]|eukprot:Sro194_g082760.1 furan-3-one reductase (546) ;mRNA; f:28862-30499